MVDRWSYVGPYFDEAKQDRVIAAQVLWGIYTADPPDGPGTTTAWSAQGDVRASMEMTGGGHPQLPLLWILEGDLYRPVHGGPLGDDPMFKFTPMHLRVEHDAAQGKTQATVVNVNENRTQILDNPVIHPFLGQAWSTGTNPMGDLIGDMIYINVAFFDRWDLFAEPLTNLLRALRPFP